MRECPSVMELDAFVGDASADGDGRICAHIIECPECRHWTEEARIHDSLLIDVRRVMSSDRGTRGASGGVNMPERIGRYAIKRILGEGGMGVVFEAEQDHPRRRVAIKVLRAGFCGEARLRRFRREAEVLGRMRHAGIAQIFDAGTVDGPHGAVAYYSMEYVDGARLTDHARTHGLDTRAKLALLADVCDAIHHAHEQGVVHRDLKPANMLVTNAGQPKVLDFGVARATESDAELLTMQTETGRLIGTLPYMSPEQVSRGGHSIDARCDVYALGVIGYELLTGSRPLSTSGMSVPEAARAICEHEPTSLGSVDRSLRGDIETIIARAMEKSPAARYRSAAAMADDIRRFLRQLPIAARPPSSLYQFGRFAQRNKAMVGGACIAVAGLIAGLAVAIWQAVGATEERDRARAASRKAEQVSGFLHEMLTSASPVDNAHDLTVREMLERAVFRLESSPMDDPEIEAALCRTIGETFTGIAAYEEAEQWLRRSLGLYESLRSPDDEDRVGAEMALSYALALHGEFDEAQMRLEALIDRGRAESDNEILLAALTDQYVDVLYEKCDYVRALPVCEAAIEMHRRLRGPNDPKVAQRLVVLGDIHGGLGAQNESIAAYQGSLRIFQEAGSAQRRDWTWTQYALGDALRTAGRLAEAREHLEAALAAQRALYGPDHVEIAHTLTSLAWVVLKDGDADEAERRHLESLAMRRRLLGDEHVHIAMQLHSLGRFYAGLERFEEAEQFQREALEMRRRLYGSHHPQTAFALHHLAIALDGLGRSEEASAAREEEQEIEALPALAQP